MKVHLREVAVPLKKAEPALTLRAALVFLCLCSASCTSIPGQAPNLRDQSHEGMVLAVPPVWRHTAVNTGEWRLARLPVYSELSFWFALGPWERSYFSIVLIFNMTCAFPVFFCWSTSPEHLFCYYFKGSTVALFIFYFSSFISF